MESVFLVLMKQLVRWKAEENFDPVDFGERRGVSDVGNVVRIARMRESGGQKIDPAYLVPFREEPFGNRAPDPARRAGYDDFHAETPFSSSKERLPDPALRFR